MSNIDLIKQRLSKLQSKGGSFEKTDYSKIFWKPKLGKQVIRIVPRKSNRDFPFVEVAFHQYNVFKKSIYCLEAFGEKDPVMQFVKELYEENSEEAKELAKKIRPRTKYFAQVLVRGEENQGVRLWEFNKTTYEKLLTIMSDEDFGNIEDIVSGTDLTVEGYNDSIKIGKREVTYVAVNVTPKRNVSPLANDQKEIESYLENQKDILEVYKKYSYDEIKNMLKMYLSPEEGSDDEESEEDGKGSAESTAPAPPVVNASSNEDDSDEDEDDTPFVPSTKKSTADKFNNLFGDE
jgi:hypothetical protein